MEGARGAARGHGRGLKGKEGAVGKRGNAQHAVNAARPSRVAGAHAGRLQDNGEEVKTIRRDLHISLG